MTNSLASEIMAILEAHTHTKYGKLKDMVFDSSMSDAQVVMLDTLRLWSANLANLHARVNALELEQGNPEDIARMSAEETILNRETVQPIALVDDPESYPEWTKLHRGLPPTTPAEPAEPDSTK